MNDQLDNERVDWIFTFVLTAVCTIIAFLIAIIVLMCHLWAN